MKDYLNIIIYYYLMSQTQCVLGILSSKGNIRSFSTGIIKLFQKNGYNKVKMFNEWI